MQEIKAGDYVYIPSYSNKPLLVKNTEIGVVIPFEVFVKERVSITFHENGKSSPHHIQPIVWLATPENKTRLEQFYCCQLEDIPVDNNNVMSTYYLQDNRTYQGNYMMWWAKNKQGYTSNIQNAHVFTADELSEMSLRPTDIVWDYDYINSKIKNCIDCQDCNHEEMKEISGLNNKVLNYFLQGWLSFNTLDTPNNGDFCEIITNSNEIIWGVWDNHHNCFTYTDVLLIKNNQYKLSDNIVGDIYIKDIKFWRKMPNLPQE